MHWGCRAVFEACCHPYHNELSRGERGGRPRIFFTGENFDNDAQQGLLDVLAVPRTANSVDDRWALIVIGNSSDALETAVALRTFAAALRESLGNDAELLPQLIVPIAAKGSRLFERASALGCSDVLEIPPNDDDTLSILSAAGLLPGSVMGLDIVKMLEGAAAMTEHFRSAPADENLVLEWVGVGHLLAERRQLTNRALATSNQGLAAICRWHDQLLSGTNGQLRRARFRPATWTPSSPT